MDELDSPTMACGQGQQQRHRQAVARLRPRRRRTVNPLRDGADGSLPVQHQPGPGVAGRADACSRSGELGRRLPHPGPQGFIGRSPGPVIGPSYDPRTKLHARRSLTSNPVRRRTTASRRAAGVRRPQWIQARPPEPVGPD